MKPGLVLLFFSLMMLGGVYNANSQAQSYRVGYAQFAGSLPDQTTISNSLSQNTVYNKLSLFEQDFIYYLNYVRLYPKVFADHAVVPYLKAYPIFKPVYGESLLVQLKEAAVASFLIPDQRMVDLARKHATDVARHDLMSHNSSDGTPMQKRFESEGVVCGSECINMLSTGSALEVLLSLLVDYQVKGFGHRKSLLAEKVVAVGVGMRNSQQGLQYTVVDLMCDKL